MTAQATALAHPNIAFIKYWGQADETRRLPANDSLSMNIAGLTTHTTVCLNPDLTKDTFLLNGEALTGDHLSRVRDFLDRVRQLADQPTFVQATSENNFPIGAGIASSASGFAALALASAAAYGLSLSEYELSSLARFGSGSACRSIPGGFVEWHTDHSTGKSYATTIAPADHWHLVDCIAILSEEHKPVGSQAGMRRAGTSPLQNARVQDSHRRIDLCRQAILQKDFTALAQVTELDSNLLHAVMMTSEPPLFYWHPTSLAIMKAVKDWQAAGIPVTYTLDAGPNVHLICLPEAQEQVLARLQQFPDVLDVLTGAPGGPAKLLTDDWHA